MFVLRDGSQGRKSTWEGKQKKINFNVSIKITLKKCRGVKCLVVKRSLSVCHVSNTWLRNSSVKRRICWQVFFSTEVDQNLNVSSDERKLIQNQADFWDRFVNDVGKLISRKELNFGAF